MNFKEIQEIIKLVAKTELAEFKLKDGGEDYLFFSKNHLDDLIIIQTKKCGPSQTR